MDLLKMMDKDKMMIATDNQQNLSAGGPAIAADMLKMAANQAASVGRQQILQYHQWLILS